jgi:tRNA nucleotidyltransferase (CCA-adding enzyme)
MPEYTYLLDTRLSAAQQNALAQVRDAAREAGMVVFLAGGAVRDLTTGSSVRDLDFAVQGNALDLQKALETRGATLWGSHAPSRSLFLWFPGSVRVEVSSTRSETFPKPGKPVYAWSGIVDDLYRRDFTVNAMALSLNEGSYGLLLDPLNGVADTEARQLRLVSNYGFIEDPSRLLRATRLARRMGWALEQRTEARFQNAKEADNFGDISDFHRGYELEEIAVEEDALATLQAFESEGWMEKLLPQWSSSHADAAALDSLHRMRIQLLMQGIAPDLTTAHLELLTARMKPEARAAFKQAMVRPGLLAAWEGLDAAAKEFGKLLAGKEMAVPSATWKLFHSHAAEPVLWLAYTGKGAAEQKFKQMFTVWPEVAKKVPVALMTELRITPELPVYAELLHELFLQQIDGRLETEEQMRAFLETYSPPAPPPPVSLKRSRSKKAAAKGKRKGAGRDLDADGDHDEDRDEDADGEERRTSLPDDAEEDEDPDHEDTQEDRDDQDDAPTPARAVKVPEKVSETRAEEAPEADASPKRKPAKDVSTSARASAAAGAVNLEGVDLGAVLDRIHSAVAPAKAAAKKQPPAAKAPATPPVKAAAVKAAAQAKVNSKTPAPAAKPMETTKKQIVPKPAAEPVAVRRSSLKPGGAVAKSAAGKSVAGKPSADKPTSKPVSKAAAKAPVPAKKAAHKPAAPAKSSLKKTTAATAKKKVSAPPPQKKQVVKTISRHPAKAPVKTPAKASAKAQDRKQATPAKKSAKKR